MGKQDFIEPALFVCLTVCAHDGLISEAEAEELAHLFFEHFSVSSVEFEVHLENFFESSEELEQLTQKLAGSIDRGLILEIAKRGASADGLDIRENIALLKVERLMGGRNG